MAAHDTIGNLLDRAVRYHRNDIALVDGERRITFDEMGARANQVARALVSLGNQPGRGAEPGDRVAMLVPNCAEFLFTSYGIWKAGLAWTQLQPLGGPESWAYVLNDARVRTLVYHPAFAEQVERTKPGLEATTCFVTVGAAGAGADPDLVALGAAEDGRSSDVAVSAETVAVVGYSSGTTGLPKGIVWRQGEWARCLLSFMLEVPEVGAGRFLHATPLTHMTSMFVLPTWLRGEANVILPRFDPSLWLATIERERISATALVPTMLYMLLDYPDIKQHDLSSLETVLYAGSPIAPDRLQEALDAFGPIFVQGYMCSEGGLISILPKRDHTPGRLASAGRPVATAEVRIIDVGSGGPKAAGEAGEIAVRSEHHMSSYWHEEKNAETLREDGFVLTGDIGQMDADGYLHIVDRRKDTIVSGGFNVFPRDVEDVIHRHPAVRNVAVIGVPHDKWGEAVQAFVVTKSDARVSAEEIRAFVRDKKGSLYTPKLVEFVSDIPLTPQGKPDKKVLRRPYWTGAKREVH